MIKATLVITDEAVSVSYVNADSVTLSVTQGASLWEADGADKIKPKGGKRVKSDWLEFEDIGNSITFTDTSGHYEENEVGDALVQLGEESVERTSWQLGRSASEQQAIVVFSADDSPAEDYTILKPIFEAESVPCCLSVITGTVAWSDAWWAAFNALGWEFVSHTVSHDNLTTLTEEQIETELANSKAFIEAKGYECNGLVYPNNSSNSTVRKVARQHYTFAATGGARLNNYPIETYGIKRVAMGAYTDTGKDTIEYYKSVVDDAVAKKQLLVFMLHSSAVAFDATQQGYLTDLIQYIKSLSVPIKTFSEAYAILGNDITIGDDSDPNATYFSLSKTGAACGSDSSRSIYGGKDTVDNDTPASSFLKNRLKHYEISSSNATGFPDNASGILVVNTLGANEYQGYIYQEYQSYGINRKYRRYCIESTGAWSAWRQIPISFKIQITTENWPTIGAGSYGEKDITITDAAYPVLYGDTVIFNTRGYFENGIIPVFAMKADNVIKVYLRNVSAGNITPADRIIYLTVFKDMAVATPTVTGNL